MDDFSDTSPVGLYDDALGSKSRDYYLNKFEDFDQIGEGWSPSWNWAAFFFTGFWALYRKLYGWFFVWWLFGTVGAVLVKVPSPFIQQGVGIAYFASFFVFSIYANSIYHRKIKARIAAAQRASSDPARVSRRLIAGSGVHAWVLVVALAIPVIGIMAAVAIPAYQDYTTRKPAAANPFDQYDRPASPENQRMAPQLKPFTGTLDKFDPSTASPVEAVAPPTQKTPEQEHFGRIDAAHPGATALVTSPAFQSWIAQYPAYQRIFKQGTAQEVIDMITAYKNQR
jgi:hypothetical protein